MGAFFVVQLLVEQEVEILQLVPGIPDLVAILAGDLVAGTDDAVIVVVVRVDPFQNRILGEELVDFLAEIIL